MEKIDHWLAIPLIHRANLGMITLDRNNESQAWIKSDAELANIYQLSAIALHNAQLIEETSALLKSVRDIYDVG